MLLKEGPWKTGYTKWVTLSKKRANIFTKKDNGSDFCCKKSVSMKVKGKGFP